MIVHDEESRILLNPRTISENDNLREVFFRLSHAGACARDAGCDAWQYAVEIEGLLGNGLDISDLRWLVNKGLIAHANEITRSQDTARRFQSCGNLSFDRRTCFVLTEAGGRLLVNEESRPKLFSVEQSPAGVPTPGARAGAAAAQTGVIPFFQTPGAGVHTSRAPAWDGDYRVLRLGEVVVKQFMVPSPSQEAVLAAFEEEGWPPAVDDPLPPRPEQDAKRRLRSTIQSLNANQKNPLLHFRGDGTGCRVVWELRNGRTSRERKPRELDRAA